MLSIAICTYNRAKLLPRAVESVMKQSLETDCEILIIDNGSTDDTREVVRDYQEKDRRIRYIYEPEPGVSHARNRALREARGEHIAFLDDDAWADTAWLRQLITPLTAIAPAPECVVGPVSLVWEGGRPNWFPARFESLLCSYDMGKTAHFLGADRYLLTTNALFHRETLLDIGGLRTDLGHKRGTLIGGEDNEIFKRLLATGRRVYYEPAARVFHPVPKQRQTRRYLLKRLFWDGASQPIIDGPPTNFSRPWRQLYGDAKRLARFTFEMLGSSVTGDRAGAEDGLYCLVQRAGTMRTHFVMATRGI